MTTNRIVSKPHKSGDKCESEWPPQYGKCSHMNGGGSKGYHAYIDPETKQLVEGYPPYVPSKAPIIIFDEMPKTYHEAAGRYISSRKEWEQADKEHNTITFGTREEVERTTKKGVKAEEKAIKADRRKASRTAIQAWKENPKEMKEKLDKRSEQQYESAKKAGILDAVKKEIKETVKK